MSTKAGEVQRKMFGQFLVVDLKQTAAVTSPNNTAFLQDYFLINQRANSWVNEICEVS